MKKHNDDIYDKHNHKIHTAYMHYILCSKKDKSMYYRKYIDAIKAPAIQPSGFETFP